MPEEPEELKRQTHKQIAKMMLHFIAPAVFYYLKHQIL